MDFKVLLSLLLLTFSGYMQGEGIHGNENLIGLILKNLFNEKIPNMELLLREKDNKMNGLETKFNDMELLLIKKEERINNLEETMNHHISAFEKYIWEKDLQLQAQDMAISKLQQEVVQKDKMVTKLQQKMAESDQMLAQLGQKMVQMDKMLAQPLKSFEDPRNHVYNQKDTKTIQLNSSEPEMVIGDEEYTQIKGGEDISSRMFTKRVSELTSTTAFHTLLTHDVTPSADKILIYDQELLDTKNSYNPSDGIYQVPESGVYVITWTTCFLNGHAQTILNINGVNRGTSGTLSTSTTNYQSSTAIVVIQLSAGDHLSIRVGTNHDPSGEFYSNDINWIQPSFSGWKLQ